LIKRVAGLKKEMGVGEHRNDEDTFTTTLKVW
jgi:hypothetical protein